MAEKNNSNKTLVLTLGSPPEKGGKKKHPGINPGQRHLKYTKAGFAIHSEPADKGRKKKKKNPGINSRQPAKKGRKRKP